MTTNLERRVPGMLGKAQATLRPSDPIAARTIAESWFYARAYTDPQIQKTFVKIQDTSERPAVVSLNSEVFGDVMAIDISSHVIGDPQVTGPDGFALAFDCAGDLGPEGLRVSVTKNDWTPLAQTHVATVSRVEITAGWNAIVLSLERFQMKDTKKPLPRWKDLDKVNLQGTTPKSHPFRIANLRWVSEPPKK